MTEQTQRMALPYPTRDTEDWFDDFVAFTSAVDAAAFASREDRGLMVMGGGTVTWDSATGALSWTDMIRVLSPMAGFQVQVAAGSVSIPTSGRVLYMNIVRAPGQNTTVSLLTANTLPSTNEAYPLAIRVGDQLLWRTGLLMAAGGSSSTSVLPGGSGGSGSGAGELIWRPTAPSSSGNVYNNWDDLATALAAAGGVGRVMIDNVGGPSTLYITSNVHLRDVTFVAGWQFSGIVMIDAGVSLTFDRLALDGVIVGWDSVGPTPMTAGSGMPVLELRNLAEIFVGSTATSAMIKSDATTTTLIVFADRGFIQYTPGPQAVPTVESPAGAGGIFAIFDGGLGGAAYGPSAFGTDVGSPLALVLAANQPQMIQTFALGPTSYTFDSLAASVTYNDAAVAPTLGVDTVQDAIDALKSTYDESVPMFASTGSTSPQVVGAMRLPGVDLSEFSEFFFGSADVMGGTTATLELRRESDATVVLSISAAGAPQAQSLPAPLVLTAGWYTWSLSTSNASYDAVIYGLRLVGAKT